MPKTLIRMDDLRKADYRRCSGELELPLKHLEIEQGPDQALMVLPARLVLPQRGRALAFPWRGQERFFARVSVPPAAMPERSFMRSALADMAPEIRAALTRTALAAAARAVTT